jgi:hypothetical protein
VNQGQTFAVEMEHGCVSTGRYDSSGRTPWHWETVTRMRPGDVTIHVAQRGIRAIGTVAGEPQLHDDAPHGHGGEASGGVYVVPVRYHALDRPILVGTLPDELRPQPPFNRRGNLQQITCCQFPEDVARRVASRWRDRWPAGSPFGDPAAWPDGPSEAAAR